MGLVAMAGGPVEELRLGSRVFKVRRAELGSVIAAAMQRIIDERPDPIATLAQSIQSVPAKDRDAAWRAAFDANQKRSHVTLDDLQEWIESATGASWLLWCMLQASRDENKTESDPDGMKGIASREDLLGIIARMKASEQAEFGSKIPVLLGLEDIKN